MCRLFGMSGGPRAVRATFWLLEAPDSLSEQSRRDPDGTGIGAFAADGTPEIHRRPLAAYEDREFARAAREVCARTFVAHVRYASNGGLTEANTHPFLQAGRLFAHNGVVGGIDALEAELGDDRRLVAGDTDSERVFALITRRIAADGDVTRGIADAVRWIDGALPVFSLNLILTTPDGLWALRWPDTHELWILEREAGGGDLHHHSPAGRIRVHSADLADAPAVIVASERMDDDDGWRLLEPGELVHVDGDLGVHSSLLLDGPPQHPLTLADLDPKAASSQQAREG